MKKTVTINLSGIVFHIDEDAYQLLDSYIKSIRSYFANVSGKEEIVEDIEGRISEVMHERISEYNQVITALDVKEVIQQIGQPEEFADGEKGEDEPIQDEGAETKQEKEGNQQGEYASSEKIAYKKLYRDVDDKMIGGVLSGLAAYTKMDVLALRIIAIILLLTTMSTIFIVYLIAWIVIPPANTVLEKMMMRGEPINIDSIGRQFSDDEYDAYTKKKSKGILHNLVRVFGILLKALGIFILIILSPVLLVAVIALIALFFALFASFFFGTTILASSIGSWSIPTVVATVLVVGIPVISLIYALFSKLLNWPTIKTSWRWILLLVWLVGLVLLIIGMTHIQWNFNEFFINRFDTLVFMR